MRSFVLGVLLACIAISGSAFESPIKPDSPREYIVTRGDTLWDISNRFLKSPWLWPEIWHANAQIHNPHLIFPGDVISLVYVDGRPRLTIVRRGESGRTIKLSPKVRTLPAESAIPAIPLQAIDSFLNNSRIFNNMQEMEAAPYVFATKQQRIIAGTGDRIYARGQVKALYGRTLGVYRSGKVISDPVSGELLGVVAIDIANAAMVKTSSDVATLRLIDSNMEVRAGDRVLPADTFSQMTAFFPRAPDAPVEGAVVSVLDGVDRVGRLNTVIINKGLREGLKQGDLLTVHKSLLVKDPVSGQNIQLPPERVGMIMVYRPFEKLSYGIVLLANEDISIGDNIKSPE
ncbi:LysM peptidoglycan-binding domain-containing protein [Endozoicomonas lisbonensis]|uniref:LysM domain-containing protein n=1 Tax=Endozoicomonas lisbonensis TaxID=3120522 RepID=A0ABV2SJR6_9GAMM